MYQVTQVQEQKVANEMQLYLGGANTKTKSLRDQYTKKIQEQENLGKGLRDKQKDIKQHHGSCMNQVLFTYIQYDLAMHVFLGKNVERFEAAVSMQARVFHAITATKDAGSCHRTGNISS